MSVRITNDGAVRTVTIDRPDCRNAVDPATADLLPEAFADFDANATQPSEDKVFA